jgi:hypothetical protein
LLKFGFVTERHEIRGGAGPSPEPSLEVDALLRRLEPRLRIEKRRLQLFSRAAEGNHPCTWLGGFATTEELVGSDRRRWPLKGARGWLTMREMVEAAADYARAHGIRPGRGLLDGITDDVWRLWSIEEVPVAILTGDPLTRHIDMSRDAIEMATPGSPQGEVIAFLRAHRGGLVAAIELASYWPPPHLPPELRIRHRERQMLVFSDRARLRDEKFGPWQEVVPVRFS